jgi:hypothetical protein
MELIGKIIRENRKIIWENIWKMDDVPCDNRLSIFLLSSVSSMLLHDNKVPNSVAADNLFLPEFEITNSN